MNHLGAVNLDEKFALFDTVFTPHRVGHLNEQVIKLVKAKGTFVWHSHENEDEMFLVHRGELVIQYRDRDVVLRRGDFHVVPRGVEHCPKADELCELILFEPDHVVNTGDATDSELTAEKEAFI